MKFLFGILGVPLYVLSHPTLQHSGSPICQCLSLSQTSLVSTSYLFPNLNPSHALTHSLDLLSDCMFMGIIAHVVTPASHFHCKYLISN